MVEPSTQFGRGDMRGGFASKLSTSIHVAENGWESGSRVCWIRAQNCKKTYQVSVPSKGEKISLPALLILTVSLTVSLLSL